MEKNNYIDNSEFLAELKEFQGLNWDEHSEWYRKQKPKNPEQKIFKEKCAKRRLNRIELLKTELEIDRKKRYRHLEIIKNKIGRKFIKITDGVLKRPSFINYDYFRKQEMISDATFFMVIYIDRYDCDRYNPFAYFTQITFNAFLQKINKVNKTNKLVTSLNYLENMDNPSHLVTTEGVYEN